MEKKIKELESKISSLETTVNSLTGNLASLQSIVNQSIDNAQIKGDNFDLRLGTDGNLKVTGAGVTDTYVSMRAGEYGKGKVHYRSEVSNGESKSSITVYENGKIECKVEKS